MGFMNAMPILIVDLYSIQHRLCCTNELDIGLEERHCYNLKKADLQQYIFISLLLLFKHIECCQPQPLLDASFMHNASLA